MDIKTIIKEDFVTIDDTATVSEMIGQLKNFEKRNGLVFRNNKYLGLIKKKKLLKLKIDSSKTKVKKIVQNTPIIKEDADVIETAYLMFQSNLDSVPVESDKQIIGTVDALDLANLAVNLPELNKLKVKDIKLLKLARIDKGDSIATAISVMSDEKVDQVPLFDKNELYGIISFRDLLRKYLNWSPKRNFSAKFNKMASSRSAEPDMPKLDNLPVSNFSTNDNLLKINHSDSLKKAVEQMVSKKISDVLVMENDQFKGMLTVKNILRKVASLKIPKLYNIKFVGLNNVNLETHQKYNLRKIAGNEAFKLQRKINNEFSLIIHIKEYEKDGHKQKYSVHLKIDYPGQVISTNQEDWDVETALRKTFNNAKNNVKSKFRGDSSWDKSYE